MNWKNILKEDNVFQEVQKEYIDFIEDILKKISEEDLGFPMYSYFDSMMPEFVKDSEELKKDIKSIIEDYPDNPYVDTKELKRMLNRLNSKKNLSRLKDAFKE